MAKAELLNLIKHKTVRESNLVLWWDITGAVEVTTVMTDVIVSKSGGWTSVSVAPAPSLTSVLAISSISIWPKGPRSCLRDTRLGLADPDLKSSEPQGDEVRFLWGVDLIGVTNPSGISKQPGGWFGGKFEPYTWPGSRNSFSEYP